MKERGSTNNDRSTQSLTLDIGQRVLGRTSIPYHSVGINFISFVNAKPTSSVHLNTEPDDAQSDVGSDLRVIAGIAKRHGGSVGVRGRGAAHNGWWPYSVVERRHEVVSRQFHNLY